MGRTKNISYNGESIKREMFEMDNTNKIRGYITPRFVIFAVTSNNGVGMIGRSRGFKRENRKGNVQNMHKPLMVTSGLHT